MAAATPRKIMVRAAIPMRLITFLLSLYVLPCIATSAGDIPAQSIDQQMGLAGRLRHAVAPGRFEDNLGRVSYETRRPAAVGVALRASPRSRRLRSAFWIRIASAGETSQGWSLRTFIDPGGKGRGTWTAFRPAAVRP